MATATDYTRRIAIVFVYISLIIMDPVLSKDGVCIRKGRIYTELPWYGYLLHKTFQENISRIQYQISYPVAECCVNLLIYYDDQMRALKPEMTCEEREAILPAANNQLIPLNNKNGTVGCTIWHEDGSEPMYVCIGERTFKSNAPRTWYIAISRCGSTTPVAMNYRFNISGYYGDCEDDPIGDTFIPPKPESGGNSNLQIAIAMGAVAGLAIIVAVVFIVLYLKSRRRLQEQPKTVGSVTSSQATMTQDIFYVNPSLSDREQSDSQYSRSSSENYYEVIPDRRSYESINTQLALSGHGGRAMNLTIPRQHGTRIPSYIFEDIPPPPYQPPQLVCQGHQHSLSQGSQGHHSQSSTASTHPLTQQAGHPSATIGHQIPMTTRLLATGSPMSTLHATGPVVTRSPLQSTALPASTSGVSAQLPIHSVSDNYSGSDSQQQQLQNGGITTSAGGLNSHVNTNNVGKPQANGHINPLQNGGPFQSGPFQSIGSNQGSMGRYPLHNANHAKLLHHAYRIQQFETTA